MSAVVTAVSTISHRYLTSNEATPLSSRVIQSNGAEYFASHHVMEKISRPSAHIPTNINYNVKHRDITNVYANSYLYEYLVVLLY